MSENLPELKEDAVTGIEEEVTEPPLFKVLLHNDNYTTKEFVVKIIVSVFGKSLEEATHLMWAVHKNGVGVCGVYPFEIAETKVNLVTATARENGFPLRSTMEPE
ncbi:MAG: ATP-dependent Clp protease adaptor ClpS [Desulfobacterales bacterium]